MQLQKPLEVTHGADLAVGQSLDELSRNQRLLEKQYCSVSTDNHKSLHKYV